VRGRVLRFHRGKFALLTEGRKPEAMLSS
jgi:hypothetical protein